MSLHSMWEQQRFFCDGDRIQKFSGLNDLMADMGEGGP